MLPSQLEFTGSHISSSPAYSDAVRALRALLVPGTAASYVRPSSRTPRSSSTSAGTPLVLAPELRLVPESEDKAAHHALALKLPFPWVPPGASSPTDLRAAVSFAVRQQSEIESWRAAQCASVNQIAHSLEPVNACLVQLARGLKHEHLLRGCNVAFIAAWCDAHQWPDVEFTQRFLLGFPVVGDIPDSHLFRPCYRPAVAHPDTFSPDRNKKWTDNVLRRVAGLASSRSAQDEEIVKGIWERTRAEACKRYVRGPYKRSQLDSLFGKNKYRAMVRFGVLQGAPGSRKLRAIDNARSSGSNDMTTTHETISCITFEFAADVSALVSACASDAGLPCPPMAIGFDDLTAAYRFVPCSQPEYTVFCVWRPASHSAPGAPVFYYVPGHNFGMTAAVLNFNRFPKLMVAMARSLLALAVDQYFDDYMVVDLRRAGSSGQDGLSFLHSLAGRPFDADKHQSMSPQGIGLGVRIDVSAVHDDGVLIISTKWHRCLSVLVMLREAARANFLPPGTASTVHGKLGFILSAAYGRVGKAAAQPLVQRMWHDTDYAFTPQLRHMLEFFEALLPELPALTIRVDSSQDDGPPVVVYTDASFRATTADGTRQSVAELGYHCAVPRPNGPPDLFHQSLRLGPETLSALSSTSATLIMQCEIAAATWVYYSAPHIFKSRRVIHFIDNTGALSALLHGYAARKLDCARMVNSFHLLAASLRLRVYFEWVPSLANVADLPSRASEPGAMHAYRRLFPDSVSGPLFLPPLDAWLPGGASSLRSVMSEYGSWVASSRPC
ncbi:hypothetical protein AB1Y20_001264 [Prymnesium parvum]|uniref:Reverse transcriptase domain-containing protein n=1 Tax=Prymnesium parvum TaxID=97485 RepID=A0AB34KC20_PRYPA